MRGDSQIVVTAESQHGCSLEYPSEEMKGEHEVNFVPVARVTASNFLRFLPALPWFVLFEFLGLFQTPVQFTEAQRLDSCV